MLLCSYKDWLDGIKLLDFQCNLLQTENRFNNFVFSYYNRIDADTKAILASEDYFKEKINKVWVHTCTLDHPNALKNYLARGMTIFKTEKIFFNPENL